MTLELNKIYNMDCIEGMRMLDDCSVNLVVTSPPYFQMRDYEVEGQVGVESTPSQYVDRLIDIFDEAKRVIKSDGSCWVNIADTYSKNGSLYAIPDMFKVAMIKSGWICRNEIIWHKPNAMPSSAKTRFNNDYEKFYFFTKNKNYYFETQYEEAKTSQAAFKKRTNGASKYKSIKQESTVRQGMNRERGDKLIEVRPNLPSQKAFVNFMRSRTNINALSNEVGIKRTKMEHWFRKDVGGFAYPSIEDWNTIKFMVDDWSNEFIKINDKLTYVEYETDDINKNIDRGRLKRAVWSINTKAFKGGHFASYPEQLIETPIQASCPEGGVVLDMFLGSGTTAIVSQKMNRNYIGFELSKEYCEIAEQRIRKSTAQIGIGL